MGGDCGQVSVCVVGAGPAGCIAAIQLSRMGYSVALLSNRRAGCITRPEILSPGALAQINSLGLAEAVSASSLGNPHTKTLLWGTSAPMRLEASGSLIDRTRFDSELLRLSRSASVAVFELDHRADARRSDTGGWTIFANSKSNPFLTASFLIDASGSGSNLLGKPKRVSLPLVAITARSEYSSLPTNEMFVEALEASWMWSATAADGCLFTGLFVDPKRLVGKEIRKALDRTISQSTIFRQSGCQGELKSFHLRNAASFKTESCVSMNHLAVGDAYVSRDPVLSGGVQWAVTSALSGIAVANTLLSSPDRSSLAIRFHRERQVECCQAAEDACGVFYRDGYRIWKSSFWKRRASRSGAVQPAAPQAQLLAYGDHFVTLSTEARFRIEPVIQNQMVEGARVLSHPSLKRPIGFVCGVPIEQLLGTLRKPMRLSCLFQTVATKVGTGNSKALVQKMLEAKVIHEANP